MKQRRSSRCCQRELTKWSGTSCIEVVRSLYLGMSFEEAAHCCAVARDCSNPKAISANSKAAVGMIGDCHDVIPFQ